MEITTIQSDDKPTIHVEHFIDFIELERVGVKLNEALLFCGARIYFNEPWLIPRAHKDALEKIWVPEQQSYRVQSSWGEGESVKWLHCQGCWVSLWGQHIPWRLVKGLWLICDHIPL